MFAGTETIYTYRDNPYRVTVTQLSKDSQGRTLIASTLKELDPEGWLNVRKNLERGYPLIHHSNLMQMVI